MNLLKLRLSSFFSLITLFTFGQAKVNQNNTIELLWEKGVSCFLNENDRCSIESFEKLLLLIPKNNIKFYPCNFYIAHSYRMLLKTEGLNNSEADRMFNCYETCLKEPVTIYNTENQRNIKSYIERKGKKRPFKLEKKWVDISD